MSSHPEKIFRENESNVIGMSVANATVRVKVIPDRQRVYPKMEQETGKKRENGK